MITEHFSCEELTITSNAALQVENRRLTGDQYLKVCDLAKFCEEIRRICGDLPVRIHSGYRCEALNGATLGSSSTSQHPKCEAVDFDVRGQSVEDSFALLLAAARAGAFKFGQLILETADRGYAKVKWVHCSVPGTLAPEKIGQVMEMQAGPDGAAHYVLVDKLSFT